MSSNGLSPVCFGLQMLLYGVPLHVLLPTFPANKRRGSDQYAESRKYLSASAGEQCRTSGTIGGRSNGSQFTECKGPSASKILCTHPYMKCSSSGPIWGEISSIRYDHSISKLRSTPQTAEDLFQHVFSQANLYVNIYTFISSNSVLYQGLQHRTYASLPDFTSYRKSLIYYNAFGLRLRFWFTTTPSFTTSFTTTSWSPTTRDS